MAQQDSKYRKPGEAVGGKEYPSLDTLVSRNVLQQLKRDPPPAMKLSEAHGQAIKPSPNSGGTDVDIVASMAKRLSLLERDAKEKGQMLQRLQVENDALKAKLKVAEDEIQRHAKAQPGGNSPGGTAAGEDSLALAHMKTENGRLRVQLRYAWKQVAEIKAFLSDYGMIWVGNPEEPSAGDGIRPRPSSSGKAPAVASEGKPQAGWGTDADGVPLPPRPPGAAAAAEGGAAMRRRISSPSPSGLAAGAAATAAGDAAPCPVSSSSPAPLPSGLLRAGSMPADGSTSAATPSSSPLPPPLRQEHSSTSPTASSSAASLNYGKPALPPLPRTPTLPGHSGPNPGAGPPLASAAPAMSSPLVPSASSGGLPFEMRKLLAAVEELNQVAGDGIGQLVGDKGRAGLGAPAAVLQTPDAVRLVLYRDGLQVHRSVPRPYHDPSSQSVLRDVLDGYFPYVLKKEFPDGVPIKVIDRTSEPLSLASAPGSAGNIRTFHDLEDAPIAPESKEQFLSRLPQTVIKNGKVIEIRSEVRRLVGAKAATGAAKPDVAIVSTPADALLTTMQRNHAGPSVPAAGTVVAATPAAAGAAAGSLQSRAPLPPTAASTTPEIATLQVKSEDGQQTFILKLQYDDNIGALRKCIDAHRAGAAKAAGKTPAASNYEIRSAFPARAYADAQETLRQAGLVPNATLFLKALS